MVDEKPEPVASVEARLRARISELEVGFRKYIIETRGTLNAIRQRIVIAQAGATEHALSDIDRIAALALGEP